MSDICFVINTVAGAGTGAGVASALPDLLRGLGRTCDVRMARRGDEIRSETERALRSGARTIVAAGGDGTVSAVATHLIGTNSCLGILPLGTFNYVARELGIPLAWQDAVRVIVDGTVRTLDAGELNGRLFLNNAGLGGYVMLVRRRERMFHWWGRSRLGAYWAVLHSLLGLQRSFALKVSVDGEMRRYRTPMAFVVRNAYQLAQHGLAGTDCIMRRQLALYVAPDCRRWQLLRLALGLALGRLQPERDFALHCGNEIVVETRQRTRHVACDGERLRMNAPFQFRLHRDALRVIAPAIPSGPGAMVLSASLADDRATEMGRCG